ncbi:uncharacterized protein LOC121782004 [Salvia splendens]|nr:uncharacterized protein LOC121782004 [Salvia splendens]
MNISWLAFLVFAVALGIMIKSKAFMKIWGLFGLLFSTVMGFFASVLFQRQTCSRPLLREDEEEDIGLLKKTKEMMTEKEDEDKPNNNKSEWRKKKKKMMKKKWSREEDEDMYDDDMRMEYDNISIWQAMENVRKIK